MTGARVVLGLDPGLRCTGWGVIEVQGHRLVHRAHGTIAPDPELSLAERLLALHRGLAALIAAQRPTEAAVEETFSNRNGASTLKLGQARGVALLAPALAGLPVAEYAATVVKRAVVGTGAAEKTQVAAMVRLLLAGGPAASADAADALAVAICHAHHGATQALWRARLPA
jgi:crossover junction endodeoxyribonuclease RuvC